MQQSAVIPAGGRWRLADLGSVRLALGLIGVLALGVIAVHFELGAPGWTLAPPLGALAFNLACAIAVHPAFRTQTALLTFHVALLGVVLLAAAGRLTYLKGTLELSDGVEFAGALTSEDSGPLHPGGYQRLKFASQGFSVQYAPGLQRAQTRNRMTFQDADGVPREAVIGDDVPLKLGGYRFYTTPNKGFAPEFIWTPAHGGAPVRGTIHLPSFPAQLTRQELEWTPPGSARSLQTRIEIEESVVDLENPWTLRSPRAHTLAVSGRDGPVVLRPGESHQFPEGTLHYAGLRMWMGYSVFYDWTVPWLLAACVLAVGALGWHYLARFRRESWHGADAGVRA